MGDQTIGRRVDTRTTAAMFYAIAAAEVIFEKSPQHNGQETYIYKRVAATNEGFPDQDDQWADHECTNRRTLDKSDNVHICVMVCAIGPEPRSNFGATAHQGETIFKANGNLISILYSPSFSIMNLTSCDLGRRETDERLRMPVRDHRPTAELSYSLNQQRGIEPGVPFTNAFALRSPCSGQAVRQTYLAHTGPMPRSRLF